MASEQTVLKILRLLAMAFPARELGEDAVNLYLATLADIPDEILEAATLDVISKNTFFPAVSELRAAAANLATGLDHFQTAAEAWGEVCRLILRWGRDREPQEWSNPITAKTVAALGWRNLCLSTNQVADRARFIETYNTYLQRAKSEAVTLPQVRRLSEKFRMPGLQPGWIAPSLPDAHEVLPDPSDIAGILEQERRLAFDRGEGESW